MKLTFTEKHGDCGYGLYCENDKLGIDVFICLIKDNENVNLGLEKIFPRKHASNRNTDDLSKLNKRFSFSFSGYVLIDIHNTNIGVIHINDIFKETNSPHKKYIHNPRDVFDLIKGLPLMSNFSEYEFEINI